MLARRLLDTVNRKNNRHISDLSDDVIARLVSYRWPGNVRELQNVLTRSALGCSGTVLQSSHLCDLQAEGSAQDSDRICTLTGMEQIHIRWVLKAVEWNRGRACRLLGIKRPTLRRKMRLFNMDKRVRDTEVEVESKMPPPIYT